MYSESQWVDKDLRRLLARKLNNSTVALNWAASDGELPEAYTQFIMVERFLKPVFDVFPICWVSWKNEIERQVANLTLYSF